MSASLFNAKEMAVPVIVKSKTMLHKMSMQGLQWPDQVDTESRMWWKKRFSTTVKRDGCRCLPNEENIARAELRIRR